MESSSTLLVLIVVVASMEYSTADNILVAHSLGMGSHITIPLKLSK